MTKKKNFMRFLALFAVGMAYGAVWNPVYIRYVFYDAMLEVMGITNLQLATLNTAFLVCSLFTQIPGGWVADRVGAKWCIGLSVIAEAPLCLLSILFPKVYAIQIIVFALFGFTAGFAFWPAVLKAVRLAGTPEQASTNFGIFEAVQGVSGMVGNFIAIWVFSKFADPVTAYKWALGSMGVWCVLGGLLMFFCYHQGTITDDTITEKTTGEKKGSALKDTLAVLKMPGTWLVSFIVMAVYGIYVSQSYFTPYFTGVLGASVVFSAAMSNFRTYGMKVIGGPCGGLFSNLLKSPSLLCGIVCVVILALVTYMSHLSAATPGVVTICSVLTMAIAFVMLCAKGVMWATMEEARIPQAITGSTIAIASYIGITLPDLCIAMIMGALLDKYADNVGQAYSVFFLILQGLCVVGAIACIINYLRGRKTKQAAAAAAAN